MTILDGKALSILEKERIKKETAKLDFQPGLTVILVGENPASQVYVRSKEKSALAAGFRSEVIRMPAETSEEGLLTEIKRLNHDKAVHGILIQLPLPKHIDENAVINAIDPDKDVDCFHPVNFGRLFIGKPVVTPCTPQGIIRLLEHHHIDIEGKRALVIGRSNIVGKPMAILLLQRHATVTIAHSRTVDLKSVALESDIIVAAVGRPNILTPDMVKSGAVIIDVGMNRVPDESTPKGYRLTGDVDYEGLKEKVAAMTPVPGGVGPMTIAMLLQNTLNLAKRARHV